MIYAAIVAVWALVLVPMWLRRHDEAAESKSADRFAKAMVSLRRGDADNVAGPQREVLMPGRPSGSHDTEIIVTGPRGQQSSSGLAAERRRRVLTGLVGLLAVTTVVVLLHKAPVWVLAVPASLVIGFLVVARRQVALAAEMRRRQQRRSTLVEAARAAEARLGAAEGRARRGGRVMDTAVVAAPAAVVIERAAPAALVEDPAAWHAVPTTLPTYVTAPRATRIPRVIDLTTPGSWTGSAMVAQARDTLAAEPAVDGAMRVETFQITVPRDPAVRAGVMVEPATYADRFVEDEVAVEALTDEDEVGALVADPRTGVTPRTYRRAANG
jgi:hypothetical protein